MDKELLQDPGVKSKYTQSSQVLELVQAVTLIELPQLDNAFTPLLFINPEGNSLGTNIYPSSYVYGSNEVSYNPNTPARVITDKVFWDN